MKRGAPLVRSPMKPSTKPMARGAGFARKPEGARKSMRRVSKTNAKRASGGEDKLCRGQPCYLLVPGIARHDVATVVPCHSNQNRHGKSMGRKADDVFTVPGCCDCHREIDQGKRFTKEEKFGIWDAAYARWEPVRDKLMGEK